MMDTRIVHDNLLNIRIVTLETQLIKEQGSKKWSVGSPVSYRTELKEFLSVDIFKADDKSSAVNTCRLCTGICQYAFSAAVGVSINLCCLKLSYIDKRSCGTVGPVLHVYLI